MEYTSTTKTIVVNGTQVHITESTPIMTEEEYKNMKNQIEEELYEIFI